METRLLSRLDRAITCVNAYDSDVTFNEKLMDVRQYARFLNERNNIFEEIINITNDSLSRKTRSLKDKEKITNDLRSIQKRLEKEFCEGMSL